MKELKINLNYLAKTYGIDLLTSASLEHNDNGTIDLIIQGDRKQ